MCGRYVIPSSAAMDSHWPLANLAIVPVQEHFNAAPTTQIPIIRQDGEGQYAMSLARWGFIPVWWSEPKPPQRTFNARTEDIFQKPMWKTPIKKHRCLIPMQGWYEWPEKDSVDENTGEVFKKGQPYFLHVPATSVIYAAGIYNILGSEGEPKTMTCSMLTTAASASIQPMHHRMVVVMGNDQLNHWLNPSLGINDIQHLMDDFAKEFSHRLVDSRVNKTSINSPDLIR